VNLSEPVREYMTGLVHASVRNDALAAARHRGFIASRILGGLIALGALPVYLVARGTPSAAEALVLAWFVTPIALAYFLSRTGRYEAAQVWWALALTSLIVATAAMSGGLASPAALWLVLVPVEAALCASRRIVLATAGLALSAAAFLFGLGDAGLAVLPSASAIGFPAVAASIGAATLYAALLALVAGSFVQAGRILLIEEEKRYRFLALNMTDVISRHGRGGVALFVSPAAHKVFGLPARELMGHGLFDRVHVADRPAYLNALAEAAMGAGSGSVEFRARRQSSEPDAGVDFIWIEMRCRSLGSAHGEPSTDTPHDVVAVMRDVTDRKAQERAIAEAHRQVEQANAAKGRFLATMSHELRTPLNAVIGFSEMLMHENEMAIDAERRHDYARLIHDSGHHLLSVVNLVLDMSKIETGNFVITAEAFWPVPVIRNCCDLMALKARDSGLGIAVNLPADLPEIVADKRALKQMLLNLLSNAIKFTDRGGEVRVGAAIEDGEIVIAIEDTGVGIDEADLPRIGDAFFQASASYDRTHDGTGLGLSIVKGLVALHGGRLDVSSRVGIGTTMTLRLPLDCEKGKASAGTVVELTRGETEAASAIAAPTARSAEGAEPEVRKRA
jgi:two-component system, cell cycle sensor histidine kinase DivJ